MDLSPMIQHAIELASKLKESASQLFEAYSLLPAVMDKEQRAIRAQDFPSVEAAGDEKAILGDKIEVCFRSICTTAEALSPVCAHLSGEPERPLTTLSECAAALSAAAQKTAGGGLATQVLSHLANGIVKLAEDFAHKQKTVKPLIEANKCLLETMLDSYQRSYRFWQEIAEETAVAYNAQGVQKAQGRNSGFRVKA